MSRPPSFPGPPASGFHRFRWAGPALWLGIPWLVILAAITLAPVDPLVGKESTPVGFLCLLCGDRGLADGILNFLFFIPLGIFLAPRGGMGRTILAAFLLSSSIEVAQILIPGRYPTAGDIVFNTSGTLAGAILWGTRERWLHPGGGEWRWALGAALAAGVVTLLAGVLFRPHLTDADYWGQWTPELGYLDAYDGRVLSAELSGIEVPSRRFPDGVDPRGALSGDFVFAVDALAGSRPVRIAPILSIYDGDQLEIVLLGAQGDDLVWRERTWARVWRLDQPDLRFRGALGGVAPGDTLALAATKAGKDRCLSIDGNRRCGLGFPVGRTWSLLFYPDGIGEAASRALDALWLFLLMFPVGFGSRRVRVAVVAGLFAGGTLVLAAVSTRLLLPPGWAWIAVAGGLAAGWLLRNTLVARRPNTER